jgi:hypothetical protein
MRRCVSVFLNDPRTPKEPLPALIGYSERVRGHVYEAWQRGDHRYVLIRAEMRAGDDHEEVELAVLSSEEEAIAALLRAVRTALSD